MEQFFFLTNKYKGDDISSFIRREDQNPMLRKAWGWLEVEISCYESHEGRISIKYFCIVISEISLRLYLSFNGTK